MPRSDKRRVSAQVSAAPHFADCLLAVHAFMVEQDAASAPARLSQLKRELRDMKTMLAWSPASGRPARFLKPNSAQASLRLAPEIQSVDFVKKTCQSISNSAKDRIKVEIRVCNDPKNPATRIGQDVSR